MIESIYDVLPSTGTALAVFTRGMHLQIEADGTGQSGNWRIDPNREFDYLIIYERDEDEMGSASNKVYVAEPVGIVESSEAGRSIIRFRNLSDRGITTSNWSEFADAGANPVRYIRN